MSQIAARISVANPEKVSVTIALTMEVETLRRLRQQLDNEYPSWCLSEIIAEALAAVDAKVLLDGREVYRP